MISNNLRELQSLVNGRLCIRRRSRANRRNLLVSPVRKTISVNLLNLYPGLRRFLRSPWWPDRINYGFTLTAFCHCRGTAIRWSQRRAENVV